jgi:phospholipase/carboxylesterase
MAIDSYAFKEKAAGRAGAPLVFAFHGTGGDEDQFLPLAARLWPQAGVIAPRGDVSEQGALRFFRRKAEGVYDFEDLATRARALAGFVRAHEARARAGRKIGLGYSNGANILAAMAFAEADLFDEILLLHPLIPWAPAANPALARLRLLITAGRRDPICPPPLTVALESYFRAQGAAVTMAWHDGGHEVRPSELAAIEGFAAATAG